MDRPAALREREGDVGVRVALAADCSLDLTFITTRWASASCSTISTVPSKFSDIAPILMWISALTESGPVFSSTLPPSTQGTTRSRSVIAAKLSSIGFVVAKGCSSSTATAGP